MSEKRDHCFHYLIDAMRVEENEQKKRYDTAIDIEDMTEATAVIIDARTRIQQIRKWLEELTKLQEGIHSYFSETEQLVVPADDSVSIEEPYMQPDVPDESIDTLGENLQKNKKR